MTPIIRHPLSLEAVLLTGGQSSRMGTDKARLLLDGVPLAERILRELRPICEPITVLGREPIPGCQFLADAVDFEGPLVALSRFAPSRAMVMVVSCDLPLFSGAIVEALARRIGAHDAVIPSLDNRIQPLCGLYRAEAFAKASLLAAQGEHRIMAWLRCLRVLEVSSDEEPTVVGARNVNTPEELAQVKAQAN